MSVLETLPYSEFLTVAKTAARLGGQHLLDWLGKAKVREKGPRDLVTEADLASQQAIEAHLRNAFPDHDFLGEEDGPTQPSQGSASEFCWIVDPLDGTTNYVHQLPSFSVSIGLTYRNQRVVGVVWDPVLEEMYSAHLGGGAWLNDLPLAHSGQQVLEQALVVISLTKNVAREDPQIESFLRLLESAGSIRRLGSAALNLCYVASGRIDAYWATQLQPWDVAAGALIAEEAGAVLRQLDGQPLDLNAPRFNCSATRRLWDEMSQVLGGPTLSQ